MKNAILFGAVALLIIANILPSTSHAQNSQGHWQLINGDPFPDSVTQVVVGPGDLVYMSTSDKGVFKSTDKGENWNEINTGLDGYLDIRMLALGPNGDLLACNARGNILHSKDGVSWTNDATPWYWDYPGAILSAFAFDSHGAAYAGTVGAGIYKMNSNGNWNPVMSPNIIPGVQAMIFDNRDRLILHYDKLYRLKSDFSGIDTSWSITTNVRNAPVQLLKSTWGSVLVVDDTLFDLTDRLQKLAPVESEMLVVDSTGVLNSFSDGLLQSTDRGITWQNHSGKISHGPTRDRFVEATSYGFLSSGDGEPEVSVSFDTTMNFIAFRELDQNLTVTVQVDRKGNLQVFDLTGRNFGEGNGGIWSSDDHGKTWRRRMSRQNIQGTLLEDGKYYTPQAWPPMVSEDGLNYKPLNVPQGIKGSLYVSPSGVLWIYYGSAHFIRSLDSGATWNEFAHITDAPPQYFNSDSAEARGVVERDPYIWLATDNIIHLTSDDGRTWQVDTAHYIFESEITGGKGSTIITHTSGEGIHWLSPGENPDSSWLDVNGAYAQGSDATMFQFALTHYDNGLPQPFIRETKSGNIIDTLCVTPDSLSFPYDQQYFTEPNMAIDSFENIFAAATGSSSTKAGLYRFVPARSSVSPQSLPLSNVLDVSISNGVLSIRSKTHLQKAELMDLMGRVLMTISIPNSLSSSTTIAGIPNGAYFVKAETNAGAEVRKIIVLR